ncbi:MAG: rhomboid family intramembrane serine protease [Deltaproteobacteria bacterium]|nr:rhomboid family intramembrane serine protease [Deltaproteobacteria bacterium]
MVFPSTQVEFGLERLPWLSGGIALISACVFFAIPTPHSTRDHDPRAALQSAFSFWQTHGYLTPDDRILDAANERFDERRRPIVLAAIRELGRRGMPEDEITLNREQATLDQLALAARPDRDRFNPLPPGHVLREYGFIPQSPSALTAVTHLFLYAGWFHFLSVVVLLFVLGASAEQRLGSPAFAVFFSLSALVSIAAQMLLEPESPMSLIGASGPVAALAAVFMLRHRMEPVRMVALVPQHRGVRLIPFELPAASIAAAWFVTNLGLIVWLEEIGVRNDLSISAQAGGLGFGLLTGLALRWLESESASEIRSPAERSSLFDEVPVAEDVSEIERSFDVLRAAAERNPEDPQTALQCFEAATTSEQAKLAAEPLVRQIRRLIRRNRAVQAAALWRSLVERLPNHQLPPDDLVRIVPALLADDQMEFALSALRQCANAPAGDLGLGLALRILDLAEGLDPFTALIAARRALEFPELHESKRERILALVRELDPEAPRPVEPEVEDFVAVAAAPQLDDSEAFELPADWENREAEFGTNDDETDETKEAPQIDLAALPRFEGIQAIAAIPTRLMDEVLYFRLDSGRKAKVAYAEIQALAVAAVRDVSSKPVVVVDLLLNWTELGAAPLRSIRLRSDQFDPARLVESSGSPTDNLRAFLQELLERSEALPLPDANAVKGRPFRVFKFLRGYQRRVLKIDC